MTGVAVLLIIGGATLVYSAFKGLDPRSLVTSVFTGDEPTPLAPIPGAVLPGNTVSGAPLTGGRPPGGGGIGRNTAAIDTVVAALRQKWPEVRIGGTYVCKRILGSSTPSQHAWGNAVDFSGPSPLYMSRMAAWAVGEAKAGRLPIAQVLWFYKDQLNGGYVYDHTTHVHISGKPMMTGTPPCMGQQK